VLLETAFADERWSAFHQPGWSADHTAATSPQHELVVILALKQRNLAFLEERARAVSDPMESSYGQHYTRDEVNSIAGPADENVAIVREFLATTPGKVRFSRGRDLVRFVCSAECIEKAFGTKLLPQRGPPQPGTSAYRAATRIQLPPRVAAVLDGVSLNAPIFMPPRPKQAPLAHFVYPSAGRLAPLINPNVIAGDQFLSLRFVAYCKDGEASREMLEMGLCAKKGPSIVSFEIVILQQPMMQKVVQLPATRDVLGQTVVDCDGACTEFNATIGGIQNYANTTARIRAHFSDGSVSPFSSPAEIPPVWPLPYTTPALLSKIYGIPLNTPVRHPRNILSIAEFLGQYYNPVDLETFFHLMGVRSWNGAGRTQPQLIGPDKPVAGSVFGGEAQLDVQYIMAMAPNVTTRFWSVPGQELATSQEPFLDWLMQVADTSDDTIPLVHSVSYGDDAAPMPEWFKQRVNQEFMKLALRGISVLIAAGDDGASGTRVRTDPSACSQANPEFPSGSPWVTAVGGTQLSKAATPVCTYSSSNVIVSCHDEGEVACTSSKGGGITSGGGFSNDFPRPWYQQRAVESYLKQTDSPVPSVEHWAYNTSGRAYPDISAVASNYLTWMGDHFDPTSGTSASTPLVAAMVARLNDERLQQGLPPLGFLNPLLYRLAEKHPEAFNDVVMGDNRCSASRCCETGFGTSRGWDAVTGHGSPNLPVMMDLLRPGSAMVEASSPLGMGFAAQGGSTSSSSLWPGAPAALGLLMAVASLLVGAFRLGASTRRGPWLSRNRAFLDGPLLS